MPQHTDRQTDKVKWKTKRKRERERMKTATLSVWKLISLRTGQFDAGKESDSHWKANFTQNPAFWKANIESKSLAVSPVCVWPMRSLKVYVLDKRVEQIDWIKAERRQQANRSKRSGCQIQLMAALGCKCTKLAQRPKLGLSVGLEFAVVKRRNKREKKRKQLSRRMTSMICLQARNQSTGVRERPQ